ASPTRRASDRDAASTAEATGSRWPIDCPCIVLWRKPVRHREVISIQDLIGWAGDFFRRPRVLSSHVLGKAASVAISSVCLPALKAFLRALMLATHWSSLLRMTMHSRH